METPEKPETHDVVVAGGGAAGLNAALVLGRARRRVAVVDAGAPRNAPATHMHGFLSRDGMSPADLLAVGRDEVAGYGGELLEGRVDQIDPGFLVYLAAGPLLRARRVLVATGLRDELPELPGVRERWGKDLLHCPYCHGLRGPRPAARGARHRPGLGRPGAAGAAVVGRRGLLPAHPGGDR